MAMTVNRSELWNDAVKLSSERFFESFVTHVRYVRVLTSVNPDHDVRCTSWAPRSSVVVCMLEGCVTVVPRASNSLFTDK
jgi:hypothetical protein